MHCCCCCCDFGGLGCRCRLVLAVSFIVHSRHGSWVHDATAVTAQALRSACLLLFPPCSRWRRGRGRQRARSSLRRDGLNGLLTGGPCSRCTSHPCLSVSLQLFSLSPLLAVKGLPVVELATHGREVEVRVLQQLSQFLASRQLVLRCIRVSISRLLVTAHTSKSLHEPPRIKTRLTLQIYDHEEHGRRFGGTHIPLLLRMFDMCSGGVTTVGTELHL
jgi:hypothetical protein